MAVKLTKKIKPSSYNGKFCYDVTIEIEGLVANPTATRRTAIYTNLNGARDVLGNVVPRISDISNNPNATAYKYTFTRLRPSTEYSFSLEITDSNGYIALTGSSFGFTTPDDPSLDIKLMATNTGYAIKVYTPDGTAVRHLVKIYENGELRYTMPNAWGVTTVNMNDRYPATTYTVKAEMYDADGNILNTVARSITTQKAEILSMSADTTATTEFSLKAAVTFVSNVSYKRRIYWKCTPSGSPKEIAASGTHEIAKASASDTMTFSGLLPGKSYDITAELLCGDNYDSNDTKTTQTQTSAMSGSFAVQERASSVITALLTGLTAYPYARQVKFSYKKNADTSWTDLTVRDIAGGTNSEIKVMFSGLVSGKKYDFKASVYKVSQGTSTFIKDLQFSATTMAYVPTNKPTSYITSFLVVPHAGKGLIYWGHDDVNSDAFTFHLFKSSNGSSWTNLGEIDESLPYIPITGTVNTTVYYRVGVKDGNGNTHNMSQPITVKYADLEGRTYAAGDEASVSYEEIMLFANTLMRLYEYKLATDSVTSAQTSAYNALRSYLPALTKGSPIKGGVSTAFYELFVLCRTFKPAVPAFSGLFSKGMPILADMMNALEVYTALATEDI